MTPAWYGVFPSHERDGYGEGQRNDSRRVEMSTNYKMACQPCKCCGRSGDDFHIGISTGENFYLDITSDELKEVEQKAKSGYAYIANEYGDIVSFESLTEIIGSKRLIKHY